MLLLRRAGRHQRGAAILVGCGGGSESPAPPSPTRSPCSSTGSTRRSSSATTWPRPRMLHGAISSRSLEGGPGDPEGDRALRRVASDFAISSFGEQRDARRRRSLDGRRASAFQNPPLMIFSLAESNGVLATGKLAGKRVGVTTDYWRGCCGRDAERVPALDRVAGGLRSGVEGGRPGSRCTTARWTPGSGTRRTSLSAPRSRRARG